MPALACRHLEGHTVRVNLERGTEIINDSVPHSILLKVIWEQLVYMNWTELFFVFVFRTIIR